MKKFLRINDFKETTPPGLDGHRYLLAVDVGGLNNGVFEPTNSHQITVNSSGTLQAVWGQNDTQVAESSTTAATSLILDLAGAGKLDELKKIDLNTYSAPELPPTEPKASVGTILPVPDQSIPEKKETLFSFLSFDIAEVRDQINTLARELFGEHILELPQERPILDVYKSASSEEEFRNRVQSLAGICIAVNKNIIAKTLNKSTHKDIGSIILLEELLMVNSDKQRACDVCDVLKNINALRNGYPAHGDYVRWFLPAHEFFRLSYPIEDYQSAWESILGRYFDAMKALRSIFVEARNKNNEKKDAKADEKESI